MCLTCVPSSWAIVTSFKSLHSLSLSNVLFTCHSHTMNSYYNCSQYVVIIQLVSLRLCKFSFVLWKRFFWGVFFQFFRICLEYLFRILQPKWSEDLFLGLTSIFPLEFSEVFFLVFEFFWISVFFRHFPDFLTKIKWGPFFKVLICIFLNFQSIFQNFEYFLNFVIIFPIVFFRILSIFPDFYNQNLVRTFF